MWHDILSLIWIFLPVGLSNTGPVIAYNIPILRRFSQPLDFHRSWRGKRVFGDNKTLRGLMAGMIIGALTAAAQMLLAYFFPLLKEYSFGAVDYESFQTIIMGLAMGFGALIGDAVKSFFKRRTGIAPGESWAPFDQLDFVIGGVGMSLLFFTLSPINYVFVFFLALILHPTFNIISWLLRLQEKPF